MDNPNSILVIEDAEELIFPGTVSGTRTLQ